eukprot:COSAG01_NODE_4328_length_5129_cov_15.312724_5_plen_75_part_00
MRSHVSYSDGRAPATAAKLAAAADVAVVVVGVTSGESADRNGTSLVRRSSRCVTLCGRSDWDLLTHRLFLSRNQ